MTRFTNFTDDELDTIGSAFSIAFNNMEFDTPLLRLKNLVNEVQVEKKCRGLEKEKEKINITLHDLLARHIANSNYGMASSSYGEEKTMINKQLTEIKEILVKINDKI